MSYFVTGATGFIGRNLVERLLERPGTVYVLVREGSKGRLAELRSRWGADEDRVVAVVGDLSQPGLGVSERTVDELRGKVDHLFHLAAIYDMTADAESQRLANVEGTRHMVEFAEARRGGAGPHGQLDRRRRPLQGHLAGGHVRRGDNLDTHPYFRTKHDSEAIVRRSAPDPWRVYRPGIVVGHSETGEMDKIDGPYYFFKLIRRIRNVVPQWVPMIGVEGREINLVPVDFVAAAMDHIAHQRGLDGRAFHLTDPKPEERRPGDQHLRAGRPRAAGVDAHRLADGDPRAAAEGVLMMLPPVRPGSANRSSPTSGFRARSSPTSTTRPASTPEGPGGARGHRHPGAAARGLRGQALGLLGAPPRPGPVQATGRSSGPFRGEPEPSAASPRSSSSRSRTSFCGSAVDSSARSRSSRRCAGGW